jgi:pimeloyl-ACP methyl ester carboxylesterase
MKKTVFMLIALLLLFGCKQKVSFGALPIRLDKSIPFTKGTVHFDDLEVRYLTVKDYLRKDNDDLVFFLHGFNNSEYEWVKAGGFGTLFYDTLKRHPDLPSTTVVSISLGGIFVFIDGAPMPYNADLEKLFVESMIPYFKKLCGKSGRVYFIGHSMGGFNSLTVSLRHPDIISGVAAISPYVAPISPFTEAFDKKGGELKMPGFQIKMLKNLLTGAYVTEDNWFRYNPFKLIETGKQFPYIAISDAENDLPGFEWSIDNFNDELTSRGIRHDFCKSPGDHNSTCDDLFVNFLSEISKSSGK